MLAAALALDPPWLGLVVIAVAGVVASAINTIAGGGSLLTLPLLVALGLPPGLANGTNRVGVIMQVVTSVITFHRRGFRDYRVVGRLMIPALLGAIAGALLATRLGDELLRIVFGAMLAAWAVLLVVRPGRFLHAPPEPRAIGPVAHVLAVLVGLYGGFLQAGVGFPLLALLVLYLGLPAVEANAAKSALTLGYTLVTLPMFAVAGQVAWREGLVLAIGSTIGGWLGAHVQIRGGANLIRWVVVVAVAASGVAMLLDAIG